MDAARVKRGFTFALRGRMSSMTPTTPAIRTVDTKLRNIAVLSGIKMEPAMPLTATPMRIAMPPISGISGLSFL